LYFFIGWKFVLRNSRKRKRSFRRRTYRSSNGRRLSAKEYKLRRKKEIIFHTASLAVVLILIISGLIFTINKFHKPKAKQKDNQQSADVGATEDTEIAPLDVIDTVIRDVKLSPYLEKSEDADSFFKGYKVQYVESNVSTISEENMKSGYAVLLNLDTGEVIAGKNGRTRINPASMTKILTLLVAAENIDNLDDVCEITPEIVEYVYTNDCSNVGLSAGDKQTVRDLMYGTILKSGADSAICLAEHIAGSQEAFVQLMNQKLADLGLSDSAHFTNCVGIFDEDHYCTPLDIAIILKAAEENKLCNEILKARTYTTSPTPAYPNGILISNLFLRRIEDKDTHGEVLGAKTGFVHQAGSCGASYQKSNDGTHYICVTANSTSSWRCIYDHVDIYDTFTN